MLRLTEIQVREAMRANDVLAEQIFVPDREFALPTVEWLRSDFAWALQKFYGQFGISTWTPEQNDCDDFARGAAWFAAFLHHRMRRSEAGLLFGEYWYQKLNGGGHAINCTIVAGGRVVFFEPQNVVANADPIVNLALEERTLCYGYRY